MPGYVDSEKIRLKGTFGDGEVHLCRCVPAAPNGIDVILLHGVHSSANVHHLNKFRCLANYLADKGLTPWLVETSRRVRSRHEYANDVAGWIRDAFSGKSFPQEQEDVFTAVREVIKRSQKLKIWLWGFSLGGIIALSAAAGAIAPLANGAPPIDKLIVSGTGLVSYPEVEEQMMKLPVLSTLRATLSPDLLSKVRTTGFVSFRGTRDEIFPESSCRDLVNGIMLPKSAKHFVPVDGADHSMRTRSGKPCPAIMEEMVSYIAGLWL